MLSRLFGRSAPAVQPTRAHVSIYARADMLLIAADDETDAGFWITRAPVVRLAPTVDDATLGAAAHAALKTTRLGVPTPSFRSGAPPLDTFLWKAAGVRSRRAFMAGARLALLSRDGETLTLTPTRNGGSTGPGRGWHGLPSTPPLPVAVDDATLGAAVRRALDAATDSP